MIRDMHLIDQFITWNEHHRALTPSTIRHFRSTCRAWAGFLQLRGEKSLRTATTESLIAFVEKRAGEDHVSDVTIADNLCILRTFYRYLVDFGGSTDPTGCLPAFVCNNRPRDAYLTVKQVFAMLDTVKGPHPVNRRDYCIIALLWSTGLRSAELIDLHWADIDLLHATLLVRNGKGRKQRQLFLNDRLLADLTAYRKAMLAGPDTPLFCNLHRGRRTRVQLTQHQLRRIVDDAARNAAITTRVTPITLRHTFATHMYEAGVHERDIQEMMGHDTTSDTTRYIHITLNAARRILNSHVAHTWIAEECT